MNNPLTPPKLNDMKTVAARLNVSVYLIRRLEKDGRIRSVNIGARILIPEDEVIRILNDGVGKRRSRMATEAVRLQKDDANA
ncbi:MAG: helix-turn-helix domain-containing protein [Terriglobales bacterium]